MNKFTKNQCNVIVIFIVFTFFFGIVCASDDAYIDRQTMGKYWKKVKANIGYQYLPSARYNWYDNGWTSKVIKADSVDIGDGAYNRQNNGWKYNVSWAAPEPNETRGDFFLAKFYYTPNDYKQACDDVTVTWDEELEGND